MITIDKLCYQSGLRYVNAGEKFAFAVITLLLCVISRSAACACMVLAATGILTVWKGGVPVFRYLRFLLLPLAFLILSTLAIVLNISRTPADLFAIPLGGWYLTGSRQALLYALQLILTALAAVSCLYFLSFSTPMPDLLNVLGRLRCPRLLLELMLLIYRAIFVLLDIAGAIQTAQNCRLGNHSFSSKLRCMGQMLSVLLVRSLKKSSLLYDAMESRLYDGRIRVLEETAPAPAWQWGLCGLWLAGLCGLCALCALAQ